MANEIPSRDDDVSFRVVAANELLAIRRRRASHGLANGDGKDAESVELKEICGSYFEKRVPAKSGILASIGSALKKVFIDAPKRIWKGLQKVGTWLKTCVGKSTDDKEPPPKPDEKPNDSEQDKILLKHRAQMSLVGLAISGGGIRSATFGLGVIQAFAHLNMLKHFDFLSTVSGGGFIGSWLTAWIKREGSLKNVEIQLKPSRIDNADATRSFEDGNSGERKPSQRMVDREPEPIYHLREYSNYLTPKMGFFSADSWTIGAIYARNTLLNQCVLVAFVVGMLCVIRAFTAGFFIPPEGWGAIATGFMLTGLFVTLVSLTIWMSLLGRERADDTNFWTKVLHFLHLDSMGWRGPQPTKLHTALSWLHVVVLVPSLLFAVSYTWLVHATSIVRGPLNSDSRIGNAWWTHAGSWILGDRLSGTCVFGLYIAVLFVACFFLGHLPILIRNLVLGRFRSLSSLAMFPAWFAGHILFAGAAGFLAGVVLFLASLWVAGGLRNSIDAVTFGPPSILGSLALIAFIWCGVFGKFLNEEAREWLASLAAWLAMYAAAWCVSLVVSLHGSMIVLELFANRGFWLSLITTGWIGSLMVGIWSGQGEKTGPLTRNKVLEMVARVAPHLAIMGYLIGLSLVVSCGFQYYQHQTSSFTTSAFVQEISKTPWTDYFAAACGSIVLAVLIGHFVDINVFSLHGMYANRLIRCYLGASRPKTSSVFDRRGGAPTNVPPPDRRPDPITGFDQRDDIGIDSLRINAPVDGKPEYFGPLLVINAALNLVQGDELGWQERKAASFVFTPYCAGSQLTGYRRLPDYAGGITLGKAVAISGAAVNPNMGYHSSPAVTALLTMFNLRLGAWMGNPKRSTHWKRSSPKIGALYLLKELVGRTNFRSKYVQLSDGGHFENLGVYELIRRRCRYIVAIDSGQDGDFQFADLGNLVRKVRTDFGIRIDISTSDIAPDSQTGKSSVHCAIGKIRYADVDASMPEGVLVYLKPSLTGDEPADVRHYAKNHATFPHESTADQFFDESQFESYRALGYHVASSALGDAVARARVSTTTEIDVRSLFANLRRQWPEEPPKFADHFVDITKGFVDIQRNISDEISKQIYPELTGNSDDDRKQLHLVCHMLQVLEDAWLTMNLGGYKEHPLNRGWLTVFRRWTSSDAVRQYWPMVRGEFSSPFVSFCEEHLGLPSNPYAVEPYSEDNHQSAMTLLAKEFAAEWNSNYDMQSIFDGARGHVLDSAKREGTVDLAWLVSTKCHDPKLVPQPCGVIICVKPDALSNGAAHPELIVWIRKPFRRLGIGELCLRGPESPLDKIRELYPKRPLIARYPVRGANGVDKEAWRRFFEGLGFIKNSNGAVATDFTVLQLD